MNTVLNDENRAKELLSEIRNLEEQRDALEPKHARLRDQIKDMALLVELGESDRSRLDSLVGTETEVESQLAHIEEAIEIKQEALHILQQRNAEAQRVVYQAETAAIRAKGEELWHKVQKTGRTLLSQIAELNSINETLVQRGGVELIGNDAAASFALARLKHSVRELPTVTVRGYSVDVVDEFRKWLND